VLRFNLSEVKAVLRPQPLLYCCRNHCYTVAAAIAVVTMLSHSPCTVGLTT
jgi:hypothetical protein